METEGVPTSRLEMLPSFCMLALDDKIAGCERGPVLVVVCVFPFPPVVAAIPGGLPL